MVYPVIDKQPAEISWRCRQQFIPTLPLMPGKKKKLKSTIINSNDGVRFLTELLRLATLNVKCLDGKETSTKSEANC